MKNILFLLLTTLGCYESAISFNDIERQMIYRYIEIDDNAISPDNKFHLFVLDDGTVLLKDNINRTEKVLSPGCRGEKPITWDRNKNISCDYNGEWRYNLEARLCGTGNWCRAAEMRAAFSPDGKYAITTSSLIGGPTIFWKTDDWTSFFPFGAEGGFFKFSSDGKFVVVLDYGPKFGETISIVDMSNLSSKIIIGMRYGKGISESGESWWIEDGLESAINDSDVIAFYKRMIPSYNFTISDDNKYVIIKINDEKYLLYNIYNHTLSIFVSDK